MHRNWIELIKPKRIEVDEKSLTPTYGKFSGEPFERGFGVTIGNSMRRVLLSSLQGAAITGVRIAGVCGGREDACAGVSGTTGVLPVDEEGFGAIADQMVGCGRTDDPSADDDGVICHSVAPKQLLFVKVLREF